ncbi:hypothetical protein AU210_011139 [Fusarium oxysporum f. sp. radicis-cucumerinum]|uniref:Zn(2)-C6 fungal-type domain-containing protein n=2 Tax=Fusarium oxysporum TaxID=5507 RepID=A0A2H3GFG3_FUSOX|nr:hypothetical protein AU210_011139 [Fusarium oxysporum f. sp. radicis-cucumerinum]RKK12916.1 hypothetical protein BFJ65_g12170 [Fusarium oxysporum f. sp. cepae]RKK30449.1 hypothetical protein BFJ67_g15750 [Fusarium oxysporum f. sp. cepae]RKK30521.1 hypothetical protein BFJ66_g16274 [Fusarium oxysporum f. sp. cepae]
MASPIQSKARLRTQTGCLKCRKRRKKCDEVKPQCKGCIRNGLECTWPTAADLIADRRRVPLSWKSQPSLPEVLSGLSLQHADYVALLSHFVDSICPRIVRRECRPEYFNHEYILRLAYVCPPLMAVIIAVAAFDKETPRYDRLAMESYQFSLHNLRTRIARAANAGNDDALLATTVFLCVFENLRSDTQLNLNLHLTATGALLTQRDSAETQVNPRSVTVFERLCAESFLYHSSLMMLFNLSLDALANTGYTLNWIRYFSNSQPEAEVWPNKKTQPVLDAPYNLFLLIACVTRLARVTRPLNEGEVETWKELNYQLLEFKQTTSHDAYQLHFEAMHIMLLKVHPIVPESEVMEQVYRVLQDGSSILYALDTHSNLLAYLLWPLTVLGSIAVDSQTRRLVKAKIDELARRRHGLVTRTQKWLRYIWDLPQGDRAMMTRRGLRILVGGSQIGKECV